LLEAPSGVSTRYPRFTASNRLSQILLRHKPFVINRLSFFIGRGEPLTARRRVCEWYLPCVSASGQWQVFMAVKIDDRACD
jgi:hypothetical protein